MHRADINQLRGFVAGKQPALVLLPAAPRLPSIACHAHKAQHVPSSLASSLCARTDSPAEAIYGACARPATLPGCF